MSIGRQLSRGTWVTLRFILYALLMILRIPVQVLSRVLSLPLVGCGAFWGLIAGWTSPACVWLTGVGLGLYVGAFLFDTVLLWISPEPLYLDT
jgi:hypothetical protein